jgi:hypothetical protein
VSAFVRNIENKLQMTRAINRQPALDFLDAQSVNATDSRTWGVIAGVTF